MITVLVFSFCNEKLFLIAGDYDNEKQESLFPVSITRMITYKNLASVCNFQAKDFEVLLSTFTPL